MGRLGVGGQGGVRRFISYLRVSTKAQGASGLGVDAQREAVARYLAGCDGELLHEYAEVESGKTADRPQLQEALRHCRLTGAVLVVAKLDRLSRNAVFLMTLRDSGTGFVAADMPDANDLTVGIMALVAQQERQAISRRTKEALAAAKSRGVKLGNPKGAAHLQGRGNPEAVAALKAKATARAVEVAGVIKRLQEEGSTSYAGLARELTRRGVLTPRGGREWTATGVRRVLQRTADTTEAMRKGN